MARYQEQATSARPVVLYTAHNRGLIQLAVANNATFGTYGQDIADPFTGERIPSCVYPKNSDHVYLWVGAFWIGAVVDRDTLVSVGTEDFYVTQEFWPDEQPFGNFTYESIDVNSPFYTPNAYSEEDIICTYSDTNTDPGLVDIDPFTNLAHRPLGIEVTQRSMAWSYEYADDFILFDYQIRNIGQKRLSKVYMGIWVDGDVWHVSRNGPEGWNDDIVGFLIDHPAPEGCGFMDTVNIAYTADNDGDPDGGRWDYRSPRGVVGARVVRTPSDSLQLSYNWWIINYSDPARDFGPRKLETPGDPFRSFGGRLGTPEGDPNKYYVLRHREFDYDLIYTATDNTDKGYRPPPPQAEEYARGWDTRYLLSFGPFSIDPGQTLPISFAWVAGENLHQQPNDFDRLFDPNFPDFFYNELDFSNLALNARWASWVYDNPGRDTDGDGYFGKFRVCAFDSLIERIDTTITGPDTAIDTLYRYTEADTFYYEGDGVPDFEGAGPPPAPRMRVIPSDGKLTVRWNGYFTETTPDVFLGDVDFEGYRVYIALDDRLTSFSLLQSYDVEDYNRYRYGELPNGSDGWVLEEVPFTLDSLRTLFGEPDFEPLLWTRSRPWEWEGEFYYFEGQDNNQSDLTRPDGIRKVYPEATRPDPDSTTWTEDEVTDAYGDPLPKYYEYEYTIDNILPTVPYYVAVSAFDYGSPASGLPALETSPVNNMIMEYPQTPADTVERYDLDVYVYPNPYLGDGRYARAGFENRDRSEPPERARLIHFANLPRVCTISIYSLDGDLVKEIEHNYPTGGPGSMHATWDLITRNTQAVVSGIYYWVVESAERTQQGKLVIIK
ncbi:hypothetical protein GF420_08425 [candidate division GN15 bacterium]|nr:hypothetical protein [candidate division GN15 bacterium]